MVFDLCIIIGDALFSAFWHKSIYLYDVVEVWSISWSSAGVCDNSQIPAIIERIWFTAVRFLKVIHFI